MSISIEEKRKELFDTIADRNEEAMVRLLMADPSLVRACDAEEYSAIHRCAKHGTASMMHKLITEFNADVNAYTYANRTAAVIAAEYNNIPCLLELLKNNADTTLHSLRGSDPLDMLYENHPGIKHFYKTGNFLTHNGEHLAVKIGDTGAIEDLNDFL